MTSTVIIDNYAQDKRFFILFTEEEFAQLNDVWDQNSALLEEYSKIDLFRGMKKWSDLTIQHFNFLLIKSLTDYFQQPDEIQFDDEHPITASLRFFITALLKKLVLTTNMNVEVLKIKYLNDYTVNFEVQSNLTLTLGNKDTTKEDSKKSALTVVVDNTKGKDS